MSATCHVMTAAISTGLPAASLTLRTSLSKLRILSDTRDRMVKGLIHQNPSLRTEPM